MENDSESRLKRTSPYHIHVYLGGSRGLHHETFMAAYESLRLHEQNVLVTYKDVASIRKEHPHWNHAKYLVDWLEASDIYFVLSQCPYLGFYGIWDIEECLLEFQRLRPHAGYPDDLSDPVLQAQRISLSPPSLFIALSHSLPFLPLSLSPH